MTQYPLAYHGGVSARSSGLDRTACPFDTGQMVDKHWWLAGWHDQDMSAVPLRHTRVVMRRVHINAA
jgi:ribosome modulation factor